MLCLFLVFLQEGLCNDLCEWWVGRVLVGGSPPYVYKMLGKGVDCVVANVSLCQQWGVLAVAVQVYLVSWLFATA